MPEEALPRPPGTSREVQGTWTVLRGSLAVRGSAPGPCRPPPCALRRCRRLNQLHRRLHHLSHATNTTAHVAPCIHALQSIDRPAQAQARGGRPRPARPALAHAAPPPPTCMPPLAPSISRVVGARPGAVPSIGRADAGSCVAAAGAGARGAGHVLIVVLWQGGGGRARHAAAEGAPAPSSDPARPTAPSAPQPPPWPPPAWPPPWRCLLFATHRDIGRLLLLAAALGGRRRLLGRARRRGAALGGGALAGRLREGGGSQLCFVRCVHAPSTPAVPSRPAWARELAERACSSLAPPHSKTNLHPPKNVHSSGPPTLTGLASSAGASPAPPASGFTLPPAPGGTPQPPTGAPKGCWAGKPPTGRPNCA